MSEKPTNRDSSEEEGREETTSVPSRIELSPDNIEQGLAKLVLTLIDFLRQLLERQAIRRMEGGALSDQEIEEMGEALMKLEAKITRVSRTVWPVARRLEYRPGPLRPASLRPNYRLPKLLKKKTFYSSYTGKHLLTCRCPPSTIPPFVPWTGIFKV